MTRHIFLHLEDGEGHLVAHADEGAEDQLEHEALAVGGQLFHILHDDKAGPIVVHVREERGHLKHEIKLFSSVQYSEIGSLFDP